MLHVGRASTLGVTPRHLQLLHQSVLVSGGGSNGRRPRHSYHSSHGECIVSFSSSTSSSSTARQPQAPRLRNWRTDRADVTFQFKCTQCGKCCTGKGGRVRVNEREIEAIAAVVGAASVADVQETYLRRVPVTNTNVRDATHSSDTDAQWMLRQTPDDAQCVFLDGTKCSIYAARPTQCRTFPWWPQHLVSDYDWHLAARDCEGITLANDHTTNPSTAFAFDDVLPHAIVHDIHRSGENFTHDELQSMLTDVQTLDPNVVRDYKRDFVQSVTRRVVYADDDVAVLDTVTLNDDTATQATTRCFVFLDRLHLIQSEVTLLSPALETETEAVAPIPIDRRSLTLDVHRVMSVAFALQASGAHAASLAAGTKKQSSKPLVRVAVLGAGAATLPLFLLEHVDAIASLDAVEPSAVVNRIAQQFFGVLDDAVVGRQRRLRVLEQTGEAFVAAQLQQLEDDRKRRLDVLLIDVDAGEAATETATYAFMRGVQAPPRAMLTPAFISHLHALLAPHGVLVVNIITADDDALARVEAAFAYVFTGSSSGVVVELEKNAVVFLFRDRHPLADDIAYEDNELQLRERLLALLTTDAFQTERVQSPALLQQRGCRVRWLRAGDEASVTVREVGDT